ncbi:MAG: GtrA family protein [Tannerellaceae bacterium]|jgi:putative flippase GtrA|nr:GtrA family protein [Tannerellaceae bacterium]
MKMIKQAIRYGFVGLTNTIITAVVIWVMTKPFGCSPILSNITGYVAGLLNSFILNKQWTFENTDRWTGSALRFVISFGVCYLLQLGVLIYLDKNFSIDPFYNQLAAMVFYTVINFLLNKFYTFKEQER